MDRIEIAKKIYSLWMGTDKDIGYSKDSLTAARYVEQNFTHNSEIEDKKKPSPYGISYVETYIAIESEFMKTHTPNSEVEDKILETEKRMLLNFRDFINNRSYIKNHIKKTGNMWLVQDLVQNRTSFAGSTSSAKKCVKLGFNTDEKGLIESRE